MNSTTTKLLLLIVSFFILLAEARSQFGLGVTTTYDLYNRYSNPDDTIAYNKNGSALMSFGLGPKLWVGGQKFSFSVEALANLAPLGLAVTDYKGLGAVSFPILAKLNFGGVSGFNKDMKVGFSLGGGLQYNKTEIFGLKGSYENRGVKRDFFKTYNIQAGVGGGVTGFTIQLFGRYGFNPDLDGARNFHVGFQADFNISKLKTIHKPESAL